MVDHSDEPTADLPRRQARGDEDAAAARVAKVLARAGVASRREVERLITAGRVALNGRVLDTPAVKVERGDVLTVDGQVIGEREPTRVWRYHKPAGLVTTHRDPKGRPTVFDALPAELPRVISVGRLDLASEGLLLLTNDGALARALELPANGWVRRYRARAFGRIDQSRLDRLKGGITVEGVAYGPIEATLDKIKHKAGEARDAPANLWITLALKEGKNREVRRVLEALGLKVNRLIRLGYGPFALGSLAAGAVEEVGPRVLKEQLAAYVDLSSPRGGTATRPRLRGNESGDRGASTSVERPHAQDAKGEPAPRPKKAYKPGWAKPSKTRRAAAAPKPRSAKVKGSQQTPSSGGRAATHVNRRGSGGKPPRGAPKR